MARVKGDMDRSRVDSILRPGEDLDSPQPSLSRDLDLGRVSRLSCDLDLDRLSRDSGLWSRDLDLRSRDLDLLDLGDRVRDLDLRDLAAFPSTLTRPLIGTKSSSCSCLMPSLLSTTLVLLLLLILTISLQSYLLLHRPGYKFQHLFSLTEGWSIEI